MNRFTGIFKNRLVAVFVLSLSSLIFLSSHVQATQVMSWAPPYSHKEVKARLQQDMGKFDVGHGLTILGLQFWTPSMDLSGGLQWAIAGDMREPEVEWFVKWGKKTNTKILLTVYNYNPKTEEWDWPLAKSAFIKHREKFIDSLLVAVEEYDLDGVDVDLEGLSDLSADRPAFKLFIHELSAKLKSKGKMLTVDSFHSPCFNAPNMSWWEDWVGKIDLITSMGYDELGEGSTTKIEGCADGAEVFKYSYQQNYGVKAGHHPSIISVGMSGWTDEFGPKGKYGNGVLAHIREVREDLKAPASVSIWDARLGREKNDWHKSEVWAELNHLISLGNPESAK